MWRNILKTLRTWSPIWKLPWKKATRLWWQPHWVTLPAAKGMAQIARETGLGRESLYKALSPEGNPKFATVLKVVRALGLRLRATPAYS
jgi:hypothetical protein